MHQPWCGSCWSSTTFPEGSTIQIWTVCAALRAGHHVNVQKPMARTLVEADEMIAAADELSVTLRVMENYLFYEPLIRLREIVRSGELGDPVGYTMKMVGTGVGGWDVPMSTWQWQMDEVAEGRGILAFDDGWHKFSVARWLFGPIAEVMGWIGATDLGGGYVMDAPSTVMWNHTNGIRGVFDMTLAPEMRMESATTRTTNASRSPVAKASSASTIAPPTDCASRPSRCTATASCASTTSSTRTGPAPSATRPGTSCATSVARKTTRCGQRVTHERSCSSPSQPTNPRIRTRRSS